MVAPATVQSAAGHGITLAIPLLTSRVTVEGLFTGIAVEGRPADCVKVAVAKHPPAEAGPGRQRDEHAGPTSVST